VALTSSETRELTSITEPPAAPELPLLATETTGWVTGTPLLLVVLVVVVIDPCLASLNQLRARQG
jgi:hypothetical protein